MKEQIKALKKAFAEEKKLFLLKPDSENDEDQQSASFIFLGTNKGKELVYDAYVMTLIQDYRLNLMEQTEERMFNLYPELEELSYDDYAEEHKNEYDDIFEAIYRSDLVKVQETLTIHPIEEEGDLIELDLTLDQRRISEKVIEDFIRSFNADAFEVNDNLRSFDIDDEL